MCEMLGVWLIECVGCFKFFVCVSLFQLKFFFHTSTFNLFRYPLLKKETFAKKVPSEKKVSSEKEEASEKEAWLPPPLPPNTSGIERNGKKIPHGGTPTTKLEG